ncbi:putative acid phosphatase [Colletotrichum truncatum]|uniref:Acid phosphatase n=1 Tax=Colletotrichum truncatum TaxID=5467 RepID=A0ACC3YCV8_COLTU|nr:putative acid phosphatase [Colletotrichum truncatum]KAF6783489.1 putative acid phosphatase [Colletotrichum truncatum]
MLPEPTLSFTLPSLHDDTVLDCRVYHCQALNPAASNPPPWKRHAAIVAHPYAPLGGCYDDPIVDIIAGSLLRLGFLVGTFNFRGASGSAGRTSWTAKPERSDYMSFVGFMVYYMHFLDPFGAHAVQSPTSVRTPSAADTQSKQSRPEHPLLLLGGYSYGAMITTQIPPLTHILVQFKTPAVGSAAADIRLRAQHLAEQQNVILASARAAQSMSPRKKYLGMRVGGDEDSQRKSHDSRRSFSLDAEDKIRRGVNELLAKTKRHHHRGATLPEEKEETRPTPQDTPLALEEVTGLTQVRPAYLLVSPLQGVITHLATMSFLPASAGRGLFARATTKPREQGAPAYTSDHRQLSETKLVENQTLALFGDKDVFVPVAKLRSWVQRLEGIVDSKFHGEEVASAGHFWTEEKVAYILRDRVVEFAAALVQTEDKTVDTGGS